MAVADVERDPQISIVTLRRVLKRSHGQNEIAQRAV